MFQLEFPEAWTPTCSSFSISASPLWDEVQPLASCCRLKEWIKIHLKDCLDSLSMALGIVYLTGWFGGILTYIMAHCADSKFKIRINIHEKHLIYSLYLFFIFMEEGRSRSEFGLFRMRGLGEARWECMKKTKMAWGRRMRDGWWVDENGTWSSLPYQVL